MNRSFSSLTNKQFDLLVVGGGIYGAWAAYDAALRGLRVALIEQRDWASATSSASSKLIHGGLRYLESLDFKLVKKALAERQMLLAMAPHRVWPLRFGVPVYADSRVGTLQLKAGLTMYDFLAGQPGKIVAGPDMAHRHFDQQSFAEHCPALNVAGLKGGFTYGDAQTDDARLVLELIAGAQSAGAVCVNYCKLTDIVEQGGRVCGATVQDQLGCASVNISARQIVNTAGQWMSASEQGRDWCRLNKGIHLVMPALPTDEALLLTAKSDGRVFFMIPWYGMTLLGTTDADYSGDLDQVAVDPQEVAYLLAEANRYLKTAWSENDVIGSYAGLRVMKRDDGASPSAVSRDWELKTADNGLHYSIGGKLTSAREDAAHIVDAVCAQIGINAPCPTKGRKFPWMPEAEYPVWLAAAATRADELGIDPESAKWLIRRHGKRAGEIFCHIASNRHLAERILAALPFIHADLLFCARHEMVVHLGDLLRRRMPLLILAKLDEDVLRRLARAVAPAMGWDDAAMNREIEACLRR
ncbi:MAG: glycerol-3-phosphate dehydrogenase/oxidase [Gallionella sp.]|nr:glycerol-3-phosphate dehydrogenase/oxidase [Gallionella sp.]